MTARKPLLSADLGSADAAAFIRGETIQPPPAPKASPAAEEARVRFTVDLPKSLHKRLKLAAVEKELPMTELAKGALEQWLQVQENS